MYVYIEMRARFSSIDRFVEKLFAWLVDRWKKRKEKGGTKRERAGKKKKKKKKRERKLNGYNVLLSVIGSRLRKYEKRVIYGI